MLKEIIPPLLSELGLGVLPGWAQPLLAMVNLVVILIAAWLSLALSNRLLSAFHARLKSRTESVEEQRRIETLERVFRYMASVVVWVVAIMLMLSELGISIAPILATAGVAGLAVGFGAQSLVKDYFTGFVMLIENQIRVGDLVEVAGKTGTVEELTLRYVRLRDYGGSVHFVPNGIISYVTNQSRDFAYAVVDVGVGYGEDLERVFSIMRSVADALRNEAPTQAKILDELDIAGVDQWADSAVMIRARLKVVALEQALVRRVFLARLKQAFDAQGIEIPFPHRRVIQVSETSTPRVDQATE